MSLATAAIPDEQPASTGTTDALALVTSFVDAMEAIRTAGRLHLDENAFALYVNLLSRITDANPVPRPSVSRLASEIGATEATVRRTRTRLVAAGLLHVAYSRGGNPGEYDRTCNRYHLLAAIHTPRGQSARDDEDEVFPNPRGQSARDKVFPNPRAGGSQPARQPLSTRAPKARDEENKEEVIEDGRGRDAESIDTATAMERIASIRRALDPFRRA